MSDEGNIKRTTKEQIDCYLNYLESHPKIKLNKNYPTRPREIEELWEDLAGQLNALKGPTRSAAKWKQCLSHWKNQVRSRARKTIAYKMVSGVGPCSQDELAPMEQRALEAFGTTVVDGIPGVPAIGAENELEFVTESDCSDYSSHTFPTSTPSSTRKRKATSNEMVVELLQSIKNRNEDEKQFRSDSLKFLGNVADSFQKVSDSMNNVATAILSLSQAIVQNMNK